MFSEHEVTPEEVDKTVESIARKVVDSEIELYARFLLAMSWPLAYVGGQLAKVFIGPYLFIFGSRENTFYEYISIFENKDNVFKLINKIDEFTEERYEKEIGEKENKGMWDKIKDFFRL